MSEANNTPSMFQLFDPSEGLWTEVSINIPQHKGGFKKQSFEACFEYIQQDEISATLRTGFNADEEESDLLHRVLRDWRKLVDYQGQPIEYNEAMRAQALNTPFLRAAMLKAFLAMVNGNAIKN